MITRKDVLKTVIRSGTDSPVIFTTGYTCRDAFALRDAPNHLYMTGSMGMAPVIGLGVSRLTDRTTVVVDGDGALLMNPAAMLAVRQYMPENFLHLVLDNGTYESTGGQHTASSLFDIPRIAAAIGYRDRTVLDDHESLDDVLPELIRNPHGPHLGYLPISGGGMRNAPRIEIEPNANFHRFRRWLTHV